MGETLYKIAQASQNEFLIGLYGAPGDHTGAELNAVKYYNYPWEGVYRAKDPEVAEKIASFMEKAVSNGFIGYDYNTKKRHTLFTELSKIDFNIEEMNVPCSTDCSALIYCAIYAATGVPFTPMEDGNGLQNSPKCSMYDDYVSVDLVPAGFEFEYITDLDFALEVNNPNGNTKYLKDLIRGDILWCGPHVGVWI